MQNTELFELNSKLQDEVEKQVKKVTGKEGVMTAVFTGLSEGLVLLDENDVLRFANEASVNIFGNELAGKSLDMLFEEKNGSKLKAGERCRSSVLWKTAKSCHYAFFLSRLRILKEGSLYP